MSLIPTFSARGVPSCLQPSYFTSAVFTSSASEDVGKLLSEFGSVVYLSSQPFTTFKELWMRQGWHFAHIFVIEAPTRDTYIKTMFRLFAGSVFLSYHAILLYRQCPQSISPIPRSSQMLQGRSLASTYSIPPKCTAKTSFMQFLASRSPLVSISFSHGGGADLECRRIATLDLASRTSRHTRYFPTIFDIHPQISPRIGFLPCSSSLFDQAAQSDYPPTHNPSRRP